ncbi:hypothetical protein [Amycolatopsis sp. cmx-4-68]|uniref:hypothetical protein n=1 Tax=Amycolatopsis sp. cmx-4-68 TaxID=2790938 RepID=UPI00397B4FCD
MPPLIHCTKAIPNTVGPDCGGGGRRIVETPRAERLGERRGKTGHLVQLAFAQRGIPVDHELAGAGMRPALIREERQRGPQRGGEDLDRGRVRRAGVHFVEERLDKHLLPPEEDLALVAEVAEEGALGQADGLRDLRGEQAASARQAMGDSVEPGTDFAPAPG